MQKIICKICGLTEEEHHEFEAEMPEGCECNPGEWGKTVTDICDKYVGDGDNDFCVKCEHDLACHKG